MAIRHRSGHELVAVIEIVSPGNKNSRHGINSLVSKAVELIHGGIHLGVIDPFPPRRVEGRVDRTVISPKSLRLA